MGPYLLRRLFQSIPLLFVVAFVVFMLIHLAPGGPGATLLRPGATVQAIEAYRRELGLDRPLLVQFFDWFGQLLRGNFGYSYGDGAPVIQVILSRLPNTVILMGSSILLTLLVAIPLGVYSAVRQYSILDHLATVFVFIGISMPDYWLGFMLIVLFAVKFHLLPAGGMETIGRPFSLLDLLKHLVLPAFTLAFIQMAGITRYLRSAMLDVIHQDFVRTARAKGLPKRVVEYKHALRNALIPVVTILGLYILPTLFGGAVIAETVFNWPGMGFLYITALAQRNYPVALGITMIAATLVVIGNLVADVVYALVDPRIQYA